MLSNYTSKSEIVIALPGRVNGTLRRVFVQENFPDGRVRILQNGYFSEDQNVKLESIATFDSDGNVVGIDKSKVEELMKYHWVDSFTDDELKQHYDFDDSKLALARQESSVANKNKTIIRYNLE